MVNLYTENTELMHRVDAGEAEIVIRGRLTDSSEHPTDWQSLLASEFIKQTYSFIFVSIPANGTKT